MLAPFKIVFKDLSEFFQCAVIAPQSIDASRTVPVIPDHTLLFLTSDREDEAYYLAGLLNSIPARVALYCSSVGVQTQRYFPTDVSRVKLPEFDSSSAGHRQIVRLSKSFHKRAAEGDEEGTETSEFELASAVAEVWGIKKGELAVLNEAYRELKSLRGRFADDNAATDDGDDDE
jgi:hypothetical protein